MTATFHPAALHPAADFRRISGAGGTVGRSVVSTSSFTPDCTPNYTARRLLAAVVALAVLAATVVMAGEALGALSDLGGRPAAASEVSATPGSVTVSHVAVAGDTLWSIADRYRGEVDRGRYLEALIDLNHGTDVQIGQAVRLP